MASEELCDLLADFTLPFTFADHQDIWKRQDVTNDATGVHKEQIWQIWRSWRWSIEINCKTIYLHQIRIFLSIIFIINNLVNTIGTKLAKLDKRNMLGLINSHAISHDYISQLVCVWDHQNIPSFGSIIVNRVTDSTLISAASATWKWVIWYKDDDDNEW